MFDGHAGNGWVAEPDVRVDAPPQAPLETLGGRFGCDGKSADSN